MFITFHIIHVALFFFWYFTSRIVWDWLSVLRYGTICVVWTGYIVDWSSDNIKDIVWVVITMARWWYG